MLYILGFFFIRMCCCFYYGGIIKNLIIIVENLKIDNVFFCMLLFGYNYIV